MKIDDLLAGLMLGDGSLERQKPTYNASLRISRKETDEDYLLWSSKILSSILSEKAITRKSIYDDRTNKTYRQIRLRTKSCAILSNLHNKWYKNGKKIIDAELELNADIIKIWFADDGCVTVHKGKYGKCNFDIKFATHGFTKDEVIFLKNKLEDFFGFDFKMYGEIASSGKKQYTIRLFGVKKCKIFLRIIDPEFPLKRKSDLWRDKDCHVFEDIVYPRCKYCQSDLVYKFGKNQKGEVKFLCRGCGRQFTNRSSGLRKPNQSATGALIGEYWKE